MNKHIPSLLSIILIYTGKNAQICPNLSLSFFWLKVSDHSSAGGGSPIQPMQLPLLLPGYFECLRSGIQDDNGSVPMTCHR